MRRLWGWNWLWLLAKVIIKKLGVYQNYILTSMGIETTHTTNHVVFLLDTDVIISTTTVALCINLWHVAMVSIHYIHIFLTLMLQPPPDRCHLCSCFQVDLFIYTAATIYVWFHWKHWRGIMYPVKLCWNKTEPSYTYPIKIVAANVLYLDLPLLIILRGEILAWYCDNLWLYMILIPLPIYYVLVTDYIQQNQIFAFIYSWSHYYKNHMSGAI